MGNTVTVGYYASSYSNLNLGSGLVFVSNLEYWDVAATGNPVANLNITLGKSYPNTIITSSTVLVGLNISSRVWEEISTNVPGSLTAGTIISTSEPIVLSKYAAFTIGNKLPMSGLKTIDNVVGQRGTDLALLNGSNAISTNLAPCLQLLILM